MNYPPEATDEQLAKYVPNLPKKDGAIVLLYERMYMREGGRWWLLGN
jgi:hypothetical protein